MADPNDNRDGEPQETDEQRARREIREEREAQVVAETNAAEIAAALKQDEQDPTSVEAVITKAVLAEAKKPPEGQDLLTTYSNRPPEVIAGGAVRVIANLGIDLWIGPGTVVPDDEWDIAVANMKAAGEEPPPLRKLKAYYNGNEIEVYTFLVPESLQVAHYANFSNSLIWPIMHSTDATALIDAGKLMDDPETGYRHHRTYYYPYPGNPTKDYEKFKKLNELGNAAIAKAKKDYEKDHPGVKLDGKDWIHDYQCTNVGGHIYTHHIPFPSLDYIKKVRIKWKDPDTGELGTDILWKIGYFKDYIKQMLEHEVLTFQRPVDMKNFLEVLAAVCPEEFGNDYHERGVFDDSGHLMGTGDFGIGGAVSIQFGGKTIKIMNVPVGVDPAVALEAAKRGESLGKTVFKTADMQGAGLIPSDWPRDHVSLPEVMGTALQPGHRIFLAAHRGDYSKSTMEKLEAADRFMRERVRECLTKAGIPDIPKGTDLSEMHKLAVTAGKEQAFKDAQAELQKIHFAFFLEPSRTSIEAYRRYGEKVAAKVRELKAKYGDSMIIAPAGINNDDYLGLMRHQNTIAVVGTARKDGHDLTMREAASVRSDLPPERRAVAILTTDGTGASDVLPGAFVVRTTEKVKDRKTGEWYYRETSFNDMADQLATEYGKIYKFSRDEPQELVGRYDLAVRTSAIFTPEYFKTKVMNVFNDTPQPTATLEQGIGQGGSTLASSTPTFARGVSPVVAADDINRQHAKQQPGLPVPPRYLTSDAQQPPTSGPTTPKGTGKEPEIHRGG